MFAELPEKTLVPLVEPGSLMDDPHAAFAVLRAATPVIPVNDRRYVVLRATDVMALMRDPRITQIEGADYARAVGMRDGHAADFIHHFFLFRNGEDHVAGRTPFAKTFAHSAIRAIRGAVRRTAERIVADLPRGEVFDFVPAAAARVPAEMVAAVLGLPECDAGYFSQLVYRVSVALSPLYATADHAAVDAAARELHAYVKAQMQARIEAPRDDALGRIVAGRLEDRTMPFDVLAYQTMGVVIGGSDTTRAGVAMIVALLLQHPEQWSALKADPGLIPGAVAEGLRFEPPVASLPRFSKAPVELDGVEVPPGVMVTLSTLSAMRDPALYADPERFDIRRADHPRMHLVFGGGVHRCLGEMLARVEMEETVAALAEHAPTIKLVTPPRMVGYGGIRQITPMQVRIG